MRRFAPLVAGCRALQHRGISYGPQTLWPAHCVQGTPGAAFYPDINALKAQMIVRKGFHTGIDSYSAFRENDRLTLTGLDGYLKGGRLHPLGALRLGARLLRGVVGARCPPNRLQCRRSGRGNRCDRSRRQPHKDAGRDAPSG